MRNSPEDYPRLIHQFGFCKGPSGLWTTIYEGAHKYAMPQDSGTTLDWRLDVSINWPWIVKMKDGVEIERYNARYVSHIVWKE